MGYASSKFLGYTIIYMNKKIKRSGIDQDY